MHVIWICLKQAISSYSAMQQRFEFCEYNSVSGECVRARFRAFNNTPIEGAHNKKRFSYQYHDHAGSKFSVWWTHLFLCFFFSIALLLLLLVYKISSCRALLLVISYYYSHWVCFAKNKKLSKKKNAYILFCLCDSDEILGTSIHIKIITNQCVHDIFPFISFASYVSLTHVDYMACHQRQCLNFKIAICHSIRLQCIYREKQKQSVSYVARSLHFF